MSSSNRDSILVFTLVLIVLACLPILGLLFSNLTPESIALTRATATPTEIISPTPAPRVYLLPFRPVFAIGQTQPITSTNFLLYENGTDAFLLVGRQDQFARLQTLDSKMSFWTAAENVATGAPVPAQYDFSGRDKTIRLVPSVGYACLHEEAPPPTFSACQASPNFSSAKLTAKITSGAVIIYLIEIDGKNYYVPPDSVLTIP